jgi:hypothetical protein
MRFKDTAGLFAATVLAIGALNLGCDSGKTSEKATGENGTAKSTEGGRPENAPVTGTGLSTTGVGAGVGTGGGTGAGAGRTGYDGTVNATSTEPTTGATTPKTGGAASEPVKGGESSGATSKSGSEKSGGGSTGESK